MSVFMNTSPFAATYPTYAIPSPGWYWNPAWPPAPAASPLTPYPNNGSICLPCHANCMTCDSSSAIDNCLSCHEDAFHTTVVGSTGTCTCSPGYWPNSDAMNCSSCHATCGTCNGGTSGDCTSCKAHASGATTGGAACSCNAGYFGTADNCQLCYERCATCSAYGENMCDSSKSNGHLEGGGAGPDRAVADLYFFWSSINLQFMACHPTCGTCEGPDDDQCLTVYDTVGAKLVGGSAPSSVVCNDGRFPDPTPRNCSLCH